MTNDLVVEENLEQFKAKVFRVAMKAKRQNRWCSEIDDILKELGINAPADAWGPEPREDGMYRVGDTFWFLIRVTYRDNLNWIRTCFANPEDNTSDDPQTWGEVAEWAARQFNTVDGANVAASLAKI